MKLDLAAPVSTLFESNQVSTGSQPLTTSNGLNTYSVGDSQDGPVTIYPYRNNYWQWYQPYREYYIPLYHFNPTSDKFETAFKLARKLMEKKLVNLPQTVGGFFKLMDSIMEIL